MFWGTDRFPSVVVASSHRRRTPLGLTGRLSKEVMYRLHAFDFFESTLRCEVNITYDLSGSLSQSGKGDLQKVPLCCFGNFFEATQSVHFFHSIAARRVSCLAGGPFQEHIRQSSNAWHLSAACYRLTRCFEKPT